MITVRVQRGRFLDGGSATVNVSGHPYLPDYSVTLEPYLDATFLPAQQARDEVRRILRDAT